MYLCRINSSFLGIVKKYIWLWYLWKQNKSKVFKYSKEHFDELIGLDHKSKKQNMSICWLVLCKQDLFAFMSVRHVTSWKTFSGIFNLPWNFILVLSSKFLLSICFDLDLKTQWSWTSKKYVRPNFNHAKKNIWSRSLCLLSIAKSLYQAWKLPQNFDLFQQIRSPCQRHKIVPNCVKS